MRVTDVKFLGILLDDKLDWHTHIRHVKGKIASGNYAISSLKTLLPKQQLKTLYTSLVQPHLSYGISLWAVHTKLI